MKIIVNGESVDIPSGSGSGGDSTVLVKSPVGTIVIWSGTADNIPTGWQLCDGTNGTPDLRDKFVLGAGTNHSVSETGGSEEVTLTVEQMPSHSHMEMVPSKNMTASAYMICQSTTRSDGGRLFNNSGFNESTVTGSRIKTQSAGSSQPHPNMPPYYTLCYIMKLTADETDGVTMDQVNSAIDTKLEAYEPQEVCSTEETRIGTWIDGKPLYRKVIQSTTPSISGIMTNAINSGMVATLVMFQCCLKASDTSHIMATWYYDSTHYFTAWLHPQGIYVRLEDASVKNRPCITILEYTKTTDQAQTVATNTVLKTSALNSVQSAAVTTSGIGELESN